MGVNTPGTQPLDGRPSSLGENEIFSNLLVFLCRRTVELSNSRTFELFL